jgi:DNA-directed RNA polymerase subunit omega
MQKLSVEDIVKGNENCYSFVIAIAKRARQISEKANDEELILDEKPVQTAVQEFVEGKFRIVRASVNEGQSGGEQNKTAE